MKLKFVRLAIACALLVGASAMSFAAEGSGSSQAMPNHQSSQGAMTMGAGGMMGMHGTAGGNGMMGMGGMMGGCPMMGASAGLDPKTEMRMHGEMMRAIGDIMIKYASQAAAASSK